MRVNVGMRIKIGHSNRHLNKNRGTTLVEMLACFALVGILLAAAAGLISVTMETYYKVRQTEYGTLLQERMLERIKEVLETANGREQIQIGESGDTIEFVDRKGRIVKMGKDTSGYLEIQYLNPDNNETRLWKLDPKSYMGSQIKELKFYRACDKSPEEYDTNVIGVDIVVKNKIYGENKGYGYVEYLK